MSKQEKFVPDLMTIVQKIADEISNSEPGGTVRDAMIRIRLAKKIEAEPEIIDAAAFAADMFHRWRSRSNKALNKSAGLYIPSAYIKPAPGINKRMDRATSPDLFSWDQMNEEARATFIAAMDRKHKKIEEWLKDMNRHPDLLTLGDVQRKIYGHVDNPLQDQIDLGIADDDEDEEGSEL